MREDGGVRFGWGVDAARRLARDSGGIVIVDVLSFSTAVEIAVSRGARVFPSRDVGAAVRLAERRGAIAPSDRGRGPSLSPASLRELQSGDAIVLPSPNGAACSLQASSGGAHVVAGCLRNAGAVARWARTHDVVGVVAAGERWPDGTLRRCAEDLVGAGVILRLIGRDDLSAAARRAVTLTDDAVREASAVLSNCMSAVELKEDGFADDVMLALERDVSMSVPVMTTDGYRASPPQSMFKRPNRNTP